ncbi:hypothetical protein JTB14_038155 [Gonioctena quinquepunctata]|nr:hypothetical protein JTB14_038155 [Gonioctena quinquepunctata]
MLSNDKKTDRRGQSLLDSTYSSKLSLINGHISSDRLANFTYLGSLGQSVIDLCFYATDKLHTIDSFFVLDYQYLSDHFPLCLKLNFESPITIQQKSSTVNIIKWVDEESVNYQNALQYSPNIGKFCDIDNTYENIFSTTVSVAQSICLVTKEYLGQRPPNLSTSEESTSYLCKSAPIYICRIIAQIGLLYGPP